MLFLAACSPDEESTLPASVAEPPDAGSTTTVAPPIVTTSPAPTPTEPASMVAIGDSFVAWSDWPEFLAQRLSDGGLEVVLDDSLAKPGILAEYEPDLLAPGGAGEGLLAGADILLVQPRAGFVARPAMSAYLEGDCGGSAGDQCLAEAVDEMRAYSAEYLDRVAELVPAGATVIVLQTGSWPIDATYPGLKDDDPDRHEGLVRFVRDLMTAVEDTATPHDMMVVDVGALFNGVAYDSIAPPEYLVDDGLHLSEAGSQAVTEVLLAVMAGRALMEEVGYEDLGVGECFDETGYGFATFVNVVDCTLAHDFEVYLADAPFEPSSTDPVTAAEEAEATCQEVLDVLVESTEFGGRLLSLGEEAPTTLTCALHSLVRQRLVGSMVESS